MQGWRELFDDKFLNLESFFFIFDGFLYLMHEKKLLFSYLKVFIFVTMLKIEV